MFDEDDPRGDQEEWAPPTPQSFVRTALIFYGIMGCIALIWRMWTPGASILHPDGHVPAAGDLGNALLLGIGVGLVSLVVSEVMTRSSRLGEALADALGEGLIGLGRGDAILLALASGTAEEMFFRGALQPAVGLVLASILFGACHFLPRRELLLWSVYAVVMGIAFGLLFEWTGHLIAPIAAHVVVNGVNLPRLAKRAEERRNETMSEDDPVD